MHYWFDDMHCDKKEQYMQYYMEFWRSLGKPMPKARAG